MTYALRQWPALAVIFLLAGLTPLVTALTPWPVKILMDHALGDGSVPASLQRLVEALPFDRPSLSLIVIAAGASLGLFMLASALESLLSLVWSLAGQRMVYDLAGDLFARLQRLSLLFHGKRAVGDSLSRLTGDTWCIYTIVDSLLIAPAQHLLTLIVVGLVAWRLDPLLAGLSLIIAPALAWSAFHFGPLLKKRSQQHRQTESRLVSFIHQSLGAIGLVHAFSTERRNSEQFNALAGDAVTLAQRGAVLKNAFNFINGLTTSLGLAIVLYVGGLRVLEGVMTVGSLLVFIAYLRTLQGAAQGLLRTYGTARSMQASADRVLEILESREMVSESPQARALVLSGDAFASSRSTPAEADFSPSPGTPGEGRGEDLSFDVPCSVENIEHPTSNTQRRSPLTQPSPGVPGEGRGASVMFQRVSFGYDPAAPVLHEIDLQVNWGETIALVGPTGAGKSTLVSLIPRFFDPQQGRILIAGRDVRDLTLPSLRRQVSIVLQEPFLLPLTIAQNIAYGRSDASLAQIEAAAQAANAAEFIEQLPQGYETILGEHGATLSVGQRQRLAIARAMLKDAAIVILDEPTSALDAQTEQLVMQSFARLMRGKTCFVIAHRLSTIRLADRIIVLEQGRIVQSGTPDALLEQQGLYRRLHELQFASPQEVAS